MDLRCKKCGRWLGHTDDNMSGVVFKCGNCKAMNTFNVEFVTPKWMRLVYNKDRRGKDSTEAKGQPKTAENASNNASGEK